MKIEGYDMVKRLFSNEHGLSVYKVRRKRDHQPFILRLADYSNKQNGQSQDQWYELYENYQLTITNYKNLPRVSTISMLNESVVYSLVEYEEGKMLKEIGQLGKSEISQLIAAVRHLHSKKFVHGAIFPENIWLTNNGKVILYGAGELRALGIGQDHRYSSDIQQLVKLLKDSSLLSEEDIERLEIKRPTTIEELESIMAGAEQVDKNGAKEKAGLVEKKEKRRPKRIVSAPISVNKEKPPKRKKKSVEEEPTEQNQEQREEEKQKKLFLWIKKIAIGIISVLALLFVISLFTDEDSELEEVTVEQEVSTNVGVEEEAVNDANTMNRTDELEEKNELVKEDQEIRGSHKIEESHEVEENRKNEPAQEYLTNSITDQEIRHFMNEFLMMFVQAINTGDFSISQHLYDPKGVALNTQRNYVKSLIEKGITEQLITSEVKAITPISATQFKVATYEEYEIDYNGESKKFKSFNATYILTVNPDYSLSVHELMDLKQLRSDEIQTEEYVTNDGDDTRAIESTVRLHYGSISSDDFTTAYNQFSSSRKKQVPLEVWKKGLQENLYDELTYIKVEQVDGNKGRVYIKMTSYDDNRDGTMLVKNWAGYWNLVKENGHWTLDVPELQKVGSWVEGQY